jgi:long-chain fatty acid transport protein
MRVTGSVLAAAALAVAALPAVVGGQGFGLNEIGSCALARGQAATSAPCDDGSAIYWNPAALTPLKGWRATAGVAAVIVNGEFAEDTTGTVFPGDVPVEWPPHLFVNYGADRWAAGLGVYVPYGLTSQWEENFPGRFSALKASLATIYIQPNISYRLNEAWAIGGGPVIGHSTVELIQGVDLSEQVAIPATGGAPAATFGQFGIPRGTEFARASLEGSATGFGFNVGVHGRLTNTVQFGARYLHGIEFDFDDADARFEQIETNRVVPVDLPLPAGTIPAGTPVDQVLRPQFTSGGALVSQKVGTRIDHPAQAQVGLAYTGFANTTLSLEGVWIGWSAFEELPVEFAGPASGSNRVLIEDYEDSWSVRLGLDHAYESGWAARAGFTYVTTPAPDETVTPLLPDMDRYNFTLGAGIPLGKRFKADLAYLRVETEGRRGRIVERESRSQTAEQLNTGFYTLNANIFSLSLRAQF